MNRRSLFKAVAGLVAAPLAPKVEPKYRFEHKEYARTITIANTRIYCPLCEKYGSHAGPCDITIEGAK